jgi:hypothetical protein|tara:strand:- start:737 stop:1051 length:315 start_codon:yes stop_codon:yes gene_type:complete
MKRIIKHISVLFFALVVVVIAFEIILQNFLLKKIVPDFHQSQYNLPIVLRSNLDVTLDWFHGYLYPPFRLQTNSKHFLNTHELSYEKPKNVLAFLCWEILFLWG